MKTYQIKDLLKKEVLIVEIAAGLSQIRKNTLSVLKHDGYTLLGKPDEIREEDAEELVDEIIVENGNGILLKNYKIDQYNLVEATESLLSAIETVIFWDVNPEPKKDYFDTFGKRESLPTDKFEKDLIKWHEAELRTFDRSRTLIFVKQ